MVNNCATIALVLLQTVNPEMVNNSATFKIVHFVAATQLLSYIFTRSYMWTMKWWITLQLLKFKIFHLVTETQLLSYFFRQSYMWTLEWWITLLLLEFSTLQLNS